MGIFRCEACGALNRIPEERRLQKPKCGQCKRPIEAAGHPQAVDPAALRAAIEASPVPVLVDFWAPWCAPCRMAAPILEDIAEEQAGKLLVLKVNTDEDGGYSAGLGIRSIPTFLVFADGKEVARQSGLLPQAQFEQWVARAAGG